jgi:hypothetical protein
MRFRCSFPCLSGGTAGSSYIQLVLANRVAPGPPRYPRSGAGRWRRSRRRGSWRGPRKPSNDSASEGAYPWNPRPNDSPADEPVPTPQTCWVNRVSRRVGVGSVEIRVPPRKPDRVHLQPPPERRAVLPVTEAVCAGVGIPSPTLVQVLPAIVAARPAAPRAGVDCESTERVVVEPFDRNTAVIEECGHVVIRVLQDKQSFVVCVQDTIGRRLVKVRDKPIHVDLCPLRIAGRLPAGNRWEY